MFFLGKGWQNMRQTFLILRRKDYLFNHIQKKDSLFQLFLYIVFVFSIGILDFPVGFSEAL